MLPPSSLTIGKIPNRVSAPRQELPGARFEVETLTGPGGTPLGMSATLEQLAEFLGITGYADLTLLAAQELLVADPPSIVANTLYGITGTQADDSDPTIGTWNGSGIEQTVYVQGVRPDAYHTLGVVYNAQGIGQLVEVDVAAGTYKKLAGDLLASNNTWTGVNDYQTDFKLSRPYSNLSTSIQWYPGGIGFYDVENDTYSTVDAADYYAYNAPPAYTGYVDFAIAFQELALTSGSRIQWVQGGLTDYNAFGAYRGSITRPHRTMQDAHDAARDGDVICVLPGGSGVDALGRPYYTENYYQSKNVRVKILPGAVVGGEMLFGTYFGDAPANYILEGGGICIGLVALCRQASGKSTLTVRNIRLEGLGVFQYVANHYIYNPHVDDYIMEDCRVDSQRVGGTDGPIRNNSRKGSGQCRMIVRNTPVYTLDAPCITFSAFVPGSVVLEGPLTQLFPGGGRDAFESKNTGEGAPTTPQSDWLVDNRPSGGTGGGTVTPAPGAGGSIDYANPVAHSASTVLSASDLGKVHVLSGASFQLTLPPATGNEGRLLAVRVADTAQGLYTIAAAGSETVGGTPSRILWAGEAVILLAQGGVWVRNGGVLKAMSITLQVAPNVNHALVPSGTLYLEQLNLDQIVSEKSPAPGLLMLAGKFRAARPATYFVTGFLSVNFDAGGNGKPASTIVIRNGGYAAPKPTTSNNASQSGRADIAVTASYFDLNAADTIGLVAYVEEAAHVFAYGTNTHLATCLTVTEQIDW